MWLGSAPHAQRSVLCLHPEVLRCILADVFIRQGLGSAFEVQSGSGAEVLSESGGEVLSGIDGAAPEASDRAVGAGVPVVPPGLPGALVPFVAPEAGAASVGR